MEDWSIPTSDGDVVASYRVKGVERMRIMCSSLVQDLRTAKARRAAETLRVGTRPVVRLSFITMTVCMTPTARLAARRRRVTCLDHGGDPSGHEGRCLDFLHLSGLGRLQAFFSLLLPSSIQRQDSQSGTGIKMGILKVCTYSLTAADGTRWIC
ncbi:hypothetical protein B296_00026504 [Ensete ventricosum]|uniref:Uncharacterized protein n=1 Tax=Ensete ventricosum TaxID=4639 RepID=A0A426YXY3_ENSVE|nr:hypothetical protein B296_00026504 [Ensete ventricosum]